jgi:hypothetical protein
MVLVYAGLYATCIPVARKAELASFNTSADKAGSTCITWVISLSNIENGNTRKLFKGKRAAGS